MTDESHLTQPSFHTFNLESWIIPLEKYSVAFKGIFFWISPKYNKRISITYTIEYALKTNMKNHSFIPLQVEKSVNPFYTSKFEGFGSWTLPYDLIPSWRSSSSRVFYGNVKEERGGELFKKSSTSIKHLRNHFFGFINVSLHENK